MGVDFWYAALYLIVLLHIWLVWIQNSHLNKQNAMLNLDRKFPPVYVSSAHKIDVKEATHMFIALPPSIPPQAVQTILRVYEEKTGLVCLPKFDDIEFVKKSEHWKRLSMQRLLPGEVGFLAGLGRIERVSVSGAISNTTSIRLIKYAEKITINFIVNEYGEVLECQETNSTFLKDLIKQSRLP